MGFHGEFTRNNQLCKAEPNAFTLLQAGRNTGKWDYMDAILTGHFNWLQNFAHKKIAQAKDNPEPLKLKLRHSLEVFSLAQSIVKESAMPSGRLCLLAALYHDIARFDQYLTYGTFRDAQSFNHGAQAVKILKKENRLCEETPQNRAHVLAAICLHNRFCLPKRLPENLISACALVRDADKLDILRIMDEHLAKKPYNPTVVLSLPDDPLLHNPKVITAALEEKVAAYADLRSVNDFRVLLGTWFSDLGFPQSRRLFIKAGHARNIIEALPDNKIYTTVKNVLLRRFEAGRHE